MQYYLPKTVAGTHVLTGFTIRVIYLAGALLFSKNIKAETHNGVKTQLFKNYVKTGLLSFEHGKLYSHLFDWRQESDYDDFVEFDQSIIEPLLNEVAELNSAIKKLISRPT